MSRLLTKYVIIRMYRLFPITPQAAITTDLPSVDIAEPDPLLSTDEDAGGTPAPAASASAAHPHLIARQMATASSVKDRREKEKKAAAAERCVRPSFIIYFVLHTHFDVFFFLVFKLHICIHVLC